jgi:hypothetical protein
MSASARMKKDAIDAHAGPHLRFGAAAGVCRNLRRIADAVIALSMAPTHRGRNGSPKGGRARDATIKRAIEAMIKDPEYLKTAEAVLEGYGFNTGEQLERNIAAIGRMDAASIAWLQELLSRDFRMKFK